MSSSLLASSCYLRLLGRCPDITASFVKGDDHLLAFGRSAPRDLVSRLEPRRHTGFAEACFIGDAVFAKTMHVHSTWQAVRFAPGRRHVNEAVAGSWDALLLVVTSGATRSDGMGWVGLHEAERPVAVATLQQRPRLCVGSLRQPHLCKVNLGMPWCSCCARGMERVVAMWTYIMDVRCI